LQVRVFFQLADAIKRHIALTDDPIDLAALQLQHLAVHIWHDSERQLVEERQALFPVVLVLDQCH